MTNELLIEIDILKAEIKQLKKENMTLKLEISRLNAQKLIDIGQITFTPTWETVH